MKLRMAQEQRQIISPAMMQTFELLMLPSSDLVDELRQKQLENPLIALEKPRRMNTPSRKMSSYSRFDNQAMLENTPMNDTDLYRFVMEQIILGPFNEKQLRIAQLILSSLDENGFLTQDPAVLIENSDITAVEFEAVRRILLQMEPVGVASLNFLEYMQVQVVHRYGPSSIEARILNEFSDLLEKKLYSKIARRMGVDYASIEAAVRNIARLNRNPSGGFTRTQTQFVVPDATVTVVNGEIKIILNEDSLPEVRLNNRYMSELYRKSKEEHITNFFYRKVLEILERWDDNVLSRPLRKTMGAALLEYILDKAKELTSFDDDPGRTAMSKALYNEIQRNIRREIQEYLAVRFKKNVRDALNRDAEKEDLEKGAYEKPWEMFYTAEVTGILINDISRVLDKDMRQFVEKDLKDYVDRDTREFISQKKAEVATLIDNLKSRREIISKVIACIVDKQKDFFLKGPAFQVPLKLKNIADELSVHESTVSRVVKDKYIKTDRGIMSLKSFFSTNVGNADTSASSIKDALKKIVLNEDRDDPLSDDKIVRILQNKGMVLSRRTVAKYRDELSIPPAYMRRNPV